MPELSVIVVAYNPGCGIVGALRAMLEDLVGVDAELIVVDNASDDGTAELIRDRLPEVRLVREQRNRGYAAGVNRGLEEALGDVLVVANADVTPRPGALRRLLSAVRDNPEFGILGGLVLDSHGVPIKNCYRALPRLSDILREALFLRPRTVPRELAPDPAAPVETEVVSGSVAAVSRAALERIGPMDEQFFLYNEDVEWCRRARERGLLVGVVTDAVFEHEGGGATRSNEGVAFAARVLSDFRYFCDIEGAPERTVRRLWRVRLLARSWFYAAAAALGPRSTRARARRRSAIYWFLSDALRSFRWSAQAGEQSAHPERLMSFPSHRSEGPEDGKPRVLQLTPNMEYGGAQRLIESIVRGPLSARFRFEILCLTHVGEIGDDLRRDGCTVHVVGQSGWLSLAGWRRTRNYAALLDCDLVHSHLLPADLAAWLGFGRRVPRLSTKHSTDRWMWWLPKLFERLALAGTHEVLAVGDAVAWAKSYLGRPGMLPPVIESPPSVDIVEAGAPLFPPNRPVRLAFVGRLHPVKRVDLFLAVARELLNRRPDGFVFRIVGAGPLYSELRDLADKLGVGRAVEFRGAVSDVSKELDDVDIVLLVSDYEGVTLTVLETLARGRIPIVRRVPGAEDALPSSMSDCYVDSDEPAAFAEKVLEILSRPDAYERQLGEARLRLRTPDDYSKAMGALYDRALGREPPRTRVLHLITRLIVGGAQENTIASVARVAPERYESHLWIGPETGSEGSLLAEARARGILVRVIPSLVREIHPFKDLAALLALVRLLRTERFDIVHTHSSKAGILGRIAARLAGVPHIVHTVHGWGFHDHMNPSLKRFYVFLERWMERWTRPLVSVSHRTTRMGLDEGIGGPGSYRLIRSGIPLSRFHPHPQRRARVRRELGIGPDEIVVGSVGRLSEQKNPLDFVRVAAAILTERRDVRFLYVGDGPLRPAVEARLDGSGIRDRVILTGIREDVPDLLRAMDVFILTSLWEGLPRVVPQALATGVPVVSYNTAGIEEAVIDGSNGYLVAPGDVEGMVSRIRGLLSDPSVRAEMSSRAIDELGDSFSEDRMVSELEALYDELVSRDRDRPRQQR